MKQAGLSEVSRNLGSVQETVTGAQSYVSKPAYLPCAAFPRLSKDIQDFQTFLCSHHCCFWSFFLILHTSVCLFCPASPHTHNLITSVLSYKWQCSHSIQINLICTCIHLHLQLSSIFAVGHQYCVEKSFLAVLQWLTDSVPQWTGMWIYPWFLFNQWGFFFLSERTFYFSFYLYSWKKFAD